MTPEAMSKWDDWYDAYEEMSVSRLCQDPSFDSWYSRKPGLIIKLSIICSAAKRDETIVEWDDILESMSYIEAAERNMGSSFRSVGRSNIATEIDMVLQIIKTRKVITEKEIMSIVWKDMDSLKFDNVIETAIRTGRVKRKYNGPKGETGEIWYYFTADKGGKNAGTKVS